MHSTLGNNCKDVSTLHYFPYARVHSTSDASAVCRIQDKLYFIMEHADRDTGLEASAEELQVRILF